MDPLGRGLESLIPDKKPDEIPDIFASRAEEEGHPQTVEEQPPPNLTMLGVSSSVSTKPPPEHFVPRRSDSIFLIEIEKIEPNPYQPRGEFPEEALRELAQSIREHGVLQPILVAKREIDTPTGLEVRYQLIAGERRWRAARLAGLSQIPVVIRRGMLDERLKLELALIENVQREDLNPMEKARAFKRLMEEFNLIQREIAARIGKSRVHIANTIRLLSLPPDIQRAVSEGRITDGHARAILMAGDDSDKQRAVFYAVTDEELTVREAENRARQVGGRQLQPRTRASMVKDPEMREWQNRLEERLGTKVVLQRMGDRGKIVMEFYSEEELRGLLQKLIREV